MMLGDNPALAVEQAKLGAAAQLVRHRASRVRHVGVERRADECPPAGHRRLHGGAEPQRSPSHFWHAGKAAVEPDRAERFAVAAGEGRESLEDGIRRMTRDKPAAYQAIAR